jgi:hypothetical protein
MRTDEPVVVADAIVSIEQLLDGQKRITVTRGTAAVNFVVDHYTEKDGLDAIIRVGYRMLADRQAKIDAVVAKLSENLSSI